MVCENKHCDICELKEYVDSLQVHIKWLEDELLRYKLLLNGDTSLSTSLSTPKPS